MQSKPHTLFVVGMLIAGGLVCLLMTASVASGASENGDPVPPIALAELLSPQATSVSIQSVTYWINSTKHTLNLDNPVIDLGTSQVLMIRGRGIYKGPQGTNGFMYIYDYNKPGYVITREIGRNTATGLESPVPFVYTVPDTYFIGVGLDSPGFAKHTQVTIRVQVT